MKRIYVLLGMMMMVNVVIGQLLQWNTYGNTGTETSEPSVFNNVNIGSSNLLLGPGITGAANTNRFGGNNWFNAGNTNPNTLAEAVTGNDYIEFTVTPNSGFSFTPTSFVFNWDHSATGPASVTLRSSFDGYASNIGSVTGMPASISIGNTITISGLTNLSVATTFRLYGYAATATGGTGGFDVATNVVNVQLNGTTAPIASNSITTGAVTTPPFCVDGFTSAAGSVAYTSTGTFSGETFTAYLSDATGTFPGTAIGSTTVTGTNPAGNISITIPAGTASGTGYKIRIEEATFPITGSESAAFTITNGVSNVTGLGATNGNTVSSVSWTNPANCYDEIMIVVADGAPNNGTPTGDGSAYTANLAFGSGDALGNGFVVYKGITSPQVVTALTNGNTYHIKIFTRNGTNWSSGVETTATPVAPVLGLQLSAANTNYIIDFDNTVANVNNGQFGGVNLNTSPAAGDLNSNAWSIDGTSATAAATFGGTITSGGGVGTGGDVTASNFFAFEHATGNRGLGIQPTGAYFTPGSITLRVQNKTGAVLSNLGLAYKILVFNDQPRDNSFNLSYSTDNVTYTNVPAVDFASAQAADAPPAWVAYLRSHTITGLSVANDQFIYLRWYGDDIGGSGNRDEFALDDIAVVANPTTVYQSAAGNVGSGIINGNTQLSGNMNVGGDLNLVNGRVFIGNNNLTVGSTTGGNASNHIVTNGSGLFTVNSIGTGPVLLPVGNSTYNPLSISNGESLNWSVRVEDAVNNVVPPFNTDKAINRTWHITHSGSVTLGPDIVFNFDDADAAQKANPAAYSGDPVRNAQIWHYNGAAWIAATGALGMTGIEGPQQLTLSGYQYFSPFAIAKTSGPLPVNFVSFSGYREGSRNLLRWTTATESNNRGFEVQRSTDGINYSAIGFVNTQAPGGNSTDQLSYTFTDNAPAGLKQYYRLRQEDWSGTGKLSNIVLIRGSKPSSLSVEAIFPNPARSNVNLVLAAPVSDQVTIVLNDALGRTIMQRVVRVEPGSNTIPLDVNGLRSGSYFVRVVCSDGCEATGQLLKQ